VNSTIRQWGNSAGVRIPKQALESSDLKLNDDVEIIPFSGGITLRKKVKKTFRDIARPLISVSDWKFDREEANERR